MNNNKNTFLHFLKVFAIFLLAMIAIISNAGVWNAYAADELDGFYFIVSLLNIVSEGVLIYFFANKVLFSNKER